MTPTLILMLLALTAFALYRQSIRREVVDGRRFSLALTFAVVGLAVCGFYLPPSATSWLILAGSLLLSAIVGVVSGRLARLWIEPDGRPFSRGTPLTITLFLLLVGFKFAVGTAQYLQHAPAEHGGFGEVLLMIALMVAMRAEIIRRRALVLRAHRASS